MNIEFDMQMIEEAELENHTHAFDKDGYCLVCALHKDELLSISGVLPDVNES